MAFGHIMKIILLIILICSIVFSGYAQQPELRGVWIAWAGANIPSKEAIAVMMEDIAAHNLNVVYVDVWRYGYPYFRSEVFFQHTGLYTDPALAAGRDVLMDMIAEGHRVGLQVEAWFEYGFVACQGNNDIIYTMHPDWFAMRRDGSVLFNGSYNYKWLSHCHPDAQKFLIDLCQEVATKYDIDGIELDRVRYPELDCGYDSFTVELYKSEHNGNPPPNTISDPGWKAWRADKLTQFMSLFYDSLKAVRPDIDISNAPIVYPYGYDNFCQNWIPWINNGFLDFVTPQIYRASNATYTYELNLQLAYVNDQSKFYPGITSIYDTYLIPTTEIIDMIQTTRSRGLQGHVIWYYNTLADDLPVLRDSVYQHVVPIPNRPSNWRLPSIILNENDPNIHRSAGWIVYTTIPGFEGGCLYALGQGEEWIEYYVDIPQNGWYEVYVFIINHWNATTRAEYQLFHQNGVDTVWVNQNLSGHARWYKLGDYQFLEGINQKVLRLTNNGIGSQILFTDAIMLLNANRPLQVSMISNPIDHGKVIRNFELGPNYPNPFNSATNITFQLFQADHIRLKIYDVCGKQIAVLWDTFLKAGKYRYFFEGQELTSGIYFCVLESNRYYQAQKMILLK